MIRNSLSLALSAKMMSGLVHLSLLLRRLFADRLESKLYSQLPASVQLREGVSEDVSSLSPLSSQQRFEG